MPDKIEYLCCVIFAILFGAFEFYGLFKIRKLQNLRARENFLQTTLSQVLTNSKRVYGTYSTSTPHKQQGGAGDLFYSMSSRTQRDTGDLCYHKSSQIAIKWMLGTYSTTDPHKQQLSGCWASILLRPSGVLCGQKETRHRDIRHFSSAASGKEAFIVRVAQAWLDIPRLDYCKAAP